MNRLRSLLLPALLLAFWVSPVQADNKLSVADKASIQAAMQRHVDRQSVDGAVLYLDRETGDARRLHPVTAHPMILSYDEHYVLCFDFRDDEGESVPIDYYMARKDSGFVVFHTAVADRALLKELMKNGRVQRIK